MTIIAFIGSVFSPYYALARRRGAADPCDHCAVNVALYGRTGKRWTMTERRRGALSRSDRTLAIGGSSLAWDGAGLAIEVNERSLPWLRPVTGKIRVMPEISSERVFALDQAGQHVWRPIAPLARVETDLRQPGLKWSGTGYFDSNSGSTPLEASFSSWDWSRCDQARTRTILYDVRDRQGNERSLALSFGPDGEVATLTPPPRQQLPRSLWRVPRATRSDADSPVRIVETLEDTPFYARSLIGSSFKGLDMRGIHESLSLDRFRQPVVQCMLPFRMPRR